MASFALEKRVGKVEREASTLREELLVSRRHMYIGFGLIILLVTVLGFNFADALSTISLSLEQLSAFLEPPPA